MRSSIALLLLFVLSISSITAFILVQAESEVIIVPNDYATIGAAVDNAAEGDTIYLKKGIYANNQTLFINRTLSIIGEDAATTIINGPGFSNWFTSNIAFQISADNFKISNVTIGNCDISISVSGNGTEVSNTRMTGLSVSGSHSLISDNTLTGTLEIKGSYQTITRNFGDIETEGSFNMITENIGQCDINLKGSVNNIEGNSFSRMYLKDGDSNTISNNSLSFLDVGTYGHNCSNNTVSGNRVIGPGLWGILMGAGSYNVFHDNLIANYTGSHDYGIAIGGNPVVAEHNTFYRNILINNNKHVSANWEILGAGNYWDNGKEGNYWDDYTGTDSNGDGIGDVPYTVWGYAWDDVASGHVNFAFGKDNYPFMSPFDIDDFSIELPEWVSPSPEPSTEQSPEDWAMFGHDPMHTGSSSSTAPSTNQTLWNYTTGWYVQSSPAVANGKVYVGSYDNYLYCLDSETGALVWKICCSASSSPAVVGGRVYVGSSDHKVYCLSAAKGAYVWSYTTGNVVESSPAVVDGRVYVGSNDNKLHCLNATTGAHLWNYTTGDFHVSSPAVANGKVYIGSSDHKVYCLNATTGAYIWSYATNFFVISSPAVAGDCVYVGSRDSWIYCLNATTGALVWTFDTGGDIWGSPAVADGKVYVGSSDNRVYCLNALTGAYIWSYTTGYEVQSSPAVADGKVYVGSQAEKVYCFGLSSPTPTPTPAPTPSPTPSLTPSPSQEPTPTPSPSPSQEPTTTPSPTPQTEPEPLPTTLVVIASATSIAVVGAGLLVYFKKRSH